MKILIALVLVSTMATGVWLVLDMPFVSAKNPVETSSPAPGKLGDERPARTGGPVGLAGGIEIRGELVRKADGFHALFELDNPTEREKTVAFHWAAVCTPGGSPFGRMMPVPEIVKTGKGQETVPPSKTISLDVLVRKAQGMPAGNTVPPGQGKAPEKLPDAWTLQISANPIRKAPGWGAMIPASSSGPGRLGKGLLILSTTTFKD